MPFKSKAQARYLYAKHPDIAKRWQAESPVKVGSLPSKVTTTVKKALSGDKN